MVDVGATQTLKYSFFRGLNLRDDENELPIGQSPDAQNYQVNRQTGLRKRQGFEERFLEYDISYSFVRAANFHNQYDEHFYLAVSYPFLFLQNRENGFTTTITNSLTGDGEPFFVPLTGSQQLLVDGANAPRLISGTGSIATVPWPPIYSAQNNTKLNATSLAVAANPTVLGTEIWYPSFGTLYENRAWLAGDRLAPNRIYVSKLFDYDEFGTNSGATYDIAFFIDIQCNSPITGLKVVSDKFLVIYCAREILVLSGKFPPVTGFPEPFFRVDSLNPFVGALGPRLIVDKGDNDHFFVANNGSVYSLSNTDNFQDVQPLGLSSRIYPAFQGLDNQTLKRGFLVNHVIQSELHFWFPSQDYLYFSDQKYVYNYSAPSEEQEWSRDKKFGEIYPVDSFVDDESNELIVITSKKFLNANTGTTYDGNAIDMQYQIATLDFGDPDVRKEICNIIVYATNQSSASTNLIFYHLWEDNESGSTVKLLDPITTGVWDDAVWDESSWQSPGGKAFTKIEFTPNNKIGKVLKFRVRHQEAADIFIHSIIFRYRILGK